MYQYRNFKGHFRISLTNSDLKVINGLLTPSILDRVIVVSANVMFVLCNNLEAGFDF